MEKRQQKRWLEARVFESDPNSSKPKYFITVAYPYPNSPQHIGHLRTYALADVHARYMRQKGYEVLLPLGFHYTGTPVLSMAKRLKSGDEELKRDFINIYRVPPEVLETFTEPINIARYFHHEIKQGMIEAGYSIDWRREFTTIDPAYNKFIEWQFRRLHKLGYITKGSHPVGWCPSCGNPVGQHDTRGDVEPEVSEFTLIKFIHGESYLPTATLRPETVFGVTNVWIHPESIYVKARVDGEFWIISRDVVEKFKLLGKEVNVLEEFNGKVLIGKYVLNPVTGLRIPILPGFFVDPKAGSGVVMSVPAHAPYDYVALEELKEHSELIKRYNLNVDDIKSIKPIPVIRLEGYSEIPAEDIVKRFNIKDQKDSKLEDATVEVYSSEFHKGFMRENTGVYSNLPVSEAKEMVRRDLVKDGKAEILFELINRPIYCRCGSEVTVKVFKDQWFINYSDEKWKAMVKECLESMSIIPEALRLEFINVVDWLKEKACARRSGLGTKLPWDPDWIIESLSDSTIYMAYYIIAKYVNIHNLDPNRLNDEFFDYVFLGIGDVDSIAREVGVDSNLIKDIRNEFLYYYPLDSRHSGRDLVWNHLTYFIFNHVAIFPRELWPRQIVVNGSVLMMGQKMSKSMGNIIPLRDAIKEYGADVLRMAILSVAGLLQDVDFSPALAKSIREWIDGFFKESIELIEAYKSMRIKPKFESIDEWMISRLQKHIIEASKAMEVLEVRDSILHAAYLLDKDIQWYKKRAMLDESNEERKVAIINTLYQVLHTRVRMLAPIIPHVCEELWSLMGEEGFVSLARWPEPDESKINIRAELTEDYIMKVIEDTGKIFEILKVKPSKIYYYTTHKWRQRMFLKILEMIGRGVKSKSDIIRELLKDSVFKEHVKDISRLVDRMMDIALTTINREAVIKNPIDEYKILSEACKF
ncbi:MAG: leucine--tRNA ligase, partial [Candidatus Methanomethylicia archaeon]